MQRVCYCQYGRLVAISYCRLHLGYVLTIRTAPPKWIHFSRWLTRYVTNLCFCWTSISSVNLLVNLTCKVMIRKSKADKQRQKTKSFLKESLAIFRLLKKMAKIIGYKSYLSARKCKAAVFCWLDVDIWWTVFITEQLDVCFEVEHTHAAMFHISIGSVFSVVRGRAQLPLVCPSINYSQHSSPWESDLLLARRPTSPTIKDVNKS